jgi:hypothetical protein
MCEPTTLMALSAGSAAVGGIGNILGGQNQAAQDSRNAQAAFNAANATETAAYSRALTDQTKAAQVLGTQRAVLAAGNVSGGTGSAGRLTTDTFDTAYRSTNAVLTNANQVVQKYGADEQSYAAQGNNAIASSFIGAGTSLLGGAAAVGDQYLKWYAPMSTGTAAGNGVGSAASGVGGSILR